MWYIDTDEHDSFTGILWYFRTRIIAFESYIRGMLRFYDCFWLRSQILQDRYYRIDTTLYPNSTVHELYSFIGIPVSEAVTEFVRSSSHGQSTDDGDYEIVKDSKKVSEKWKTWDLKIINTIEEACSDFMIVFGYDVFVTTNINWSWWTFRLLIILYKL